MLQQGNELLIVEREACKRSLATFVKEAWHVLEPSMPYSHGWHIDAMCHHFEAVTYGEIKRLLINVPPGTMKSMLAAVFWPAWEWGPQDLPGTRFIGASHAEDLATRDCLKMRDLVNSEWFQERWPIPMKTDQNQKKSFSNDKFGWRQSCPVKSMTGKRGDRVLWDDPHSVEDAYSKASLATALRVFKETLPTRLSSPKDSAIVVLMQRLSEGDVSGEILSGDYGYEHLCLPMEFEPARKCFTSIGFEDPRTKEGELLFPERFPEEVVARDKAVMGSHATAGQFQQRPTTLGGELIKGEHFILYDKPPKMVRRTIYADTAMKTGEHNDFSVFECWGLGDDGKIYLLDLLRGKWEAYNLEQRAVSFWQKHKALDKELGPLNIMKVEDKASGTGLIQKLRHEAKVPIAGIPRDKDKYTRYMGISGYIEAGYVCLPKNAPFLSDFIAEAESFTADDTHIHDDQLDPMFDAIEDMVATRKIEPFIELF
jgi:predicted phage terminase large subunit-like protein